MYTQCPECLTIYKIAAELLAQGRGSARCGHCAATFDVLRSLTETLPEEPFEELPLAATGDIPPQLSVPALRPQGQPQTLLFNPDERMIDSDGVPRVLEFNVRFGDPETQPILMRLESDLVDLIEAALDGRIDASSARWNPQPAIGVVIAAHGYPGTVRTGDAIDGLDGAFPAGAKVFHAATKVENGKVLSSGGRVLTVCATGADLGQARERAYAAAERIDFDGMFYRRDIGYRALRNRGEGRGARGEG